MNHYVTNLNLISKAVFLPADNKCPEVPLLLHFFWKIFNIFFRTGLIRLISGHRNAKKLVFQPRKRLFLQKPCRPFIRCAKLTFCSVNFMVFSTLQTFLPWPLSLLSCVQVCVWLKFPGLSIIYAGMKLKKSQNRKKFRSKAKVLNSSFVRISVEDPESACRSVANIPEYRYPGPSSFHTRVTSHGSLATC